MASSDPPIGPSDTRAEQFAAKTKGLMIWDSLIEFHPLGEHLKTGHL